MTRAWPAAFESCSAAFAPSVDSFISGANAAIAGRAFDERDTPEAPGVVIVNEGVAKNLSTSTLKDDAYAFIFDQEGLMAGLSIEGTKISKIKR
jgi:hypothetical protein